MAGGSSFHREVNGGTAGDALGITAVFGQTVLLVGVLAVGLKGGGPAQEDTAIILQVSILGEPLMGVVVVEEEKQQAAAVLRGSTVSVKGPSFFERFCGG